MDNAASESDNLIRPFEFEIISDESKILNETYISQRKTQMLNVFVKLKRLEASISNSTLENVDGLIKEIHDTLELIFNYDLLIMTRLARYDSLIEDGDREYLYCYLYKSKVRTKIESLFHKLFPENSSPSDNSESHESDNVSLSQIADGRCINVTIAKSLVSLHDFLYPCSDLNKPHKFDGKQKNKLAFKKFMDKFIFTIQENDNLNDGFKLLYLQYYLGGDALEVIRDLPITNENYVVALNMLKEKYLDREFIINNYLHRIAKIIPPVESDLRVVKGMVVTIHGYILELQLLGIDFLEPGSPARTLASHIVFEKLPSQFKRDLITRVSCGHPTLNQIFEHYSYKGIAYR